MHNPLRSPGRLLPAAAIAGCVLVVAFGSIAPRAGDDDDLTDQAAAAPRRNVEFAAPEQPPRRPLTLWKRHQNNEQQKLRLDWLLVRKVGDVARASRLTELQKQKLLLAGRGDLLRLIDRMEELKARYRSAVLMPEIQNEINRKAGPIRAALRGTARLPAVRYLQRR